MFKQVEDYISYDNVTLFVRGPKIFLPTMQQYRKACGKRIGITARCAPIRGPKNVQFACLPIILYLCTKLSDLQLL